MSSISSKSGWRTHVEVVYISSMNAVSFARPNPIRDFVNVQERLQESVLMR